jgi:hypothetical protein
VLAATDFRRLTCSVATRIADWIGWLDGYMDERMSEERWCLPVHRRQGFAKVVGHEHCRLDWLDRWTGGWVGRRMDGWMDERTSEWNGGACLPQTSGASRHL